MKPRHFIPALFFSLLIAYPLSLGPLTWLHGKRHGHDEPPRWMTTIYAPLGPVLGHSQPLIRAYIWYLSKWTPIEAQ
ncbi:MAG: hypothetical protein ABJF10_01835 [Chthoniobacter sp.]|uniref:hypothetical protein n=1 Tax=Chthoniobacter sp. TaxID=2510640 RepID=UPI0032A94828